MSDQPACRLRILFTAGCDSLKQLDDASHRKLESLSRWDRDCGDAVRWLRQNHHRFKMEIFEPPMLSCTVPDNRFVHAVEACFGSAQLKACLLDYYMIVCTHHDSRFRPSLRSVKRTMRC